MDFQASPALRRLLQALRAVRGQLRVVPAANLHITLKFLGDVEEGLVPSLLEAMERAAEGVPPATLTLRGTGAFPNLRRPRVVWVGVENGDPLVTVAGRLEARLEAMGFAREHRRFSPHLTVARVKGGRGREEVVRVTEAFQEEAFGEQHVDAIRLKRSELTPKGAIYHDLGSVALG